jgi:hypothetical protein
MKIMEIFTGFDQLRSELNKEFANDRYTIEQEIIDALASINLPAEYMPALSSSGESKDKRKTFVVPSKGTSTYKIDQVLARNKIPYSVERITVFDQIPDLYLLILHKSSY